MAANPFDGGEDFDCAVCETCCACVAGVDETDVATLRCVSSCGDEVMAGVASCVVCEVSCGVASKSTSESGETEIFECTICVVGSVSDVGVDPSKISIGKVCTGVMFVVVYVTSVVTCVCGVNVGPKVVGGTCMSV